MSAVLSAPSGANATRDLVPYSKLEQKICSQLLSLTGRDINAIVGGDDALASNLKSGKLNLNWLRWIRLLTGLGYKIVSKDMQCVTAYEMRSLQDCYAYVNGDAATRARFAAWRETQPLNQDWDAPTQ
jgi:hypothetical protein